MKKIFTLLLIASISTSAILAGCGTKEYEDPVNTLTATASTDKYRNYYQIFVNSFADSNDVAAVAKTACDENDVLYIPTDNTAASNTGIIDNTATAAKTPIIAGEEGICKGCGVATLSISYYELGQKTGEMAYDILVNGADITSLKVESAPNVTKKYVKSRCDAYGITIPDDYEAIEE